MRSLVLLLKHYNVTMEDDDNQLRITCQNCNGFVTCAGRSGELLYITFIHVRISTPGIYPEELVPNNCYFQWPVRTKMQCIYRRIIR